MIRLGQLSVTFVSGESMKHFGIVDSVKNLLDKLIAPTQVVHATESVRPKQEPCLNESQIRPISMEEKMLKAQSELFSFASDMG